MLHYNHQNGRLARQLRKEMTPWERKLWYCFLKQYPVRFQRQKCIDQYIADFYCHQAKLVVELDGSQHCEPAEQAYDQKRTEYLEAQGLQVLRFSNLNVMRRFRDVCEYIDQTVEVRTAQKS